MKHFPHLFLVLPAQSVKAFMFIGLLLPALSIVEGSLRGFLVSPVISMTGSLFRSAILLLGFVIPDLFRTICFQLPDVVSESISFSPQLYVVGFIPYRLAPTLPVLSIVEGMAGVIISFRHCEAVEDGRGNLSLSFRPERSAVEKSK